MNVNGDKYILLSLVNTKLRNDYSTLCDLVYNENIDTESLILALKDIGYIYNEKLNQFVNID